MAKIKLICERCKDEIESYEKGMIVDCKFYHDYCIEVEEEKVLQMLACEHPRIPEELLENLLSKNEYKDLSKLLKKKWVIIYESADDGPDILWSNSKTALLDAANEAVASALAEGYVLTFRFALKDGNAVSNHAGFSMSVSF
ncbi:MAG: hypothetical protein PVG39_04735 [Desulfobacteraceae bacterium]|jgi:hypothetical protein